MGGATLDGKPVAAMPAKEAKAKKTKAEKDAGKDGGKDAKAS